MARKRMTFRMLVIMAAAGATVLAGTVLAQAGGPSRPVRASAYINPDTGTPTENADVNRHSECETPDQEDTQQLSTPGTTDRNVHIDACLFTLSGASFDGLVTWESIGVGYISACPDPDDAGPKIAFTHDHDSDGFADDCHQTGFQSKGLPGDGEYHARVNNDSTAGRQKVKFCWDPDFDGCFNTRVKDTIDITWVGN